MEDDSDYYLDFGDFGYQLDPDSDAAQNGRLLIELGRLIHQVEDLEQAREVLLGYVTALCRDNAKLRERLGLEKVDHRGVDFHAREAERYKRRAAQEGLFFRRCGKVRLAPRK